MLEALLLLVVAICRLWSVFMLRVVLFRWSLFVLCGQFVLFNLDVFVVVIGRLLSILCFCGRDVQTVIHCVLENLISSFCSNIALFALLICKL